MERLASGNCGFSIFLTSIFHGKKKETTVSSTEAPSTLGEIYSVQGRYFFTDDRTTLELP